MIRFEKASPPSKEALEGLKKLGHTMQESPVPLGDAKLIVIDEAGSGAWAFADGREGGLALAAKPSAPKKD